MPHEFGLAVLNANAIVQNRSVHVQVHVLVNSDREHETAVLPVKGRKIGAAAAQGQTKRSFGNDHRVLSVSSAEGLSSTHFC